MYLLSGITDDNFIQIYAAIFGTRRQQNAYRYPTFSNGKNIISVLCARIFF